MDYSPSKLYGSIGSLRLLSAFQVASGLAVRGVSKKDALAIINKMTALNLQEVPQNISYDLTQWLDWAASWAVDNGQMEWYEPYGWAVPAAKKRGWF